MWRARAVPRDEDVPARTVPLRGLVLSVAALTIPLAAARYGGEPNDAITLLPWLAALVPGFLMAYYRGWRGSAVALALGMVAVLAWSTILKARGAPAPSWQTQTALVTGLIAFCFGLGIVTELLHRARFLAGEQALWDPLTGLASKRHVEVFLEAAVTSADSADRRLSVLLLDVDHFDALCGKHGAAAGEKVVLAVAELLRARVRPPALCGRMGAARFVGVFPQSGEPEARSVAQHVRRGLTDADLPWQPLTVTSGVATLTRDISGWQALIREAERELLPPDPDRPGDRGAPEPPPVLEASHSPGSVGGSPLVDGPVAVVALPPWERRSIRLVLELSGLEVLEFDDVEDVPVLEQAGEPTLVITAVDTAEQLSGMRPLVERDQSDTITWLVFVRNDGGAARLPQVGGMTVLRDAPTGDALLPLISGLLREAREAGGTAPEAIAGGFDSVLSSPDARLTDGRILIVDDEKASRDVLRRTLRVLGFHDVHTARTGEEAMTSVIEDPPDLVILDLQMPGMDGFNVLQALAPLLEGDGFLPVLVVTGDQDPKHRQRVLSSGAKDFLNKPFDVSELAARVLNLLETRKLHLEARSANLTLEQRVHQRTQELGLAKDEIIFRLARAAEYRDDLTGRHAARVAAAASVLAAGVGLGADECEMIRRAAPLHDVGKIGIPDAILLKPGRLTSEEMAIMRRHTTIGAELLAHSTSDVIEVARVIALTHHERWDGLGYPNGLKGADIPIQGRVVALADALDALTHERPYKAAHPFHESLRQLILEAGTAFDPDVVAALQTAAFRIRDILQDESHHELAGQA